ncbi:MAG TPA: NAD(P)-binding protein [Acidimicrobiales bacterium]|nr:NAD(P)-binding protein [Acidimicrobiales bacterium]
MKDRTFEADYVIVGGGAVGMSFADVILAESDAEIIIVDKRGRPGGHWNDAYSFVRLHQPSSFYGVNSKQLGRNRRDESGPNAGLFELASRDEICLYFEQLMKDQFLPSGRVRYLPMSEYSSDGVVTSLLTGGQTRVQARRAVVDARYVGSEIPSTQAPAFGVSSGVNLIPVNGLTELQSSHGRYVVIGAGKTGVDACLWLLDNGVEPATISWVRPRDAWFQNRAKLQGGEEFFEETMGGFATQLEVAAQAESLDDLFAGMEESGLWMRISRDCWPTMFRSATMTRDEVELLRQVTDVVRLGHVIGIERDSMILEHGSIPSRADWLFIDCSAAGVPDRPPVTIFNDRLITLQYVMYSGLPTYSAAMTAYVELTQPDDAVKNTLCRPMPITGNLLDVPRNLLSDIEVRQRWLNSEPIRKWMIRSRLDPTMGVASRISRDDEPKQAVLRRYLSNIGPARANLEELMATVAAA